MLMCHNTLTNVHHCYSFFRRKRCFCFLEKLNVIKRTMIANISPFFFFFCLLFKTFFLSLPVKGFVAINIDILSSAKHFAQPLHSISPAFAQLLLPCQPNYILPNNGVQKKTKYWLPPLATAIGAAFVTLVVQISH